MEVIYRILNGLYPSYLNDIVTVDELQQLRCQARLLVPMFSTIRYGKKSLAYLSPFLWNTLDNDIKQCNVLNAFKKLCQMPNIKPMIVNTYVDDHGLDILHQ